jgi:hypothetical protein
MSSDRDEPNSSDLWTVIGILAAVGSGLAFAFLVMG